MIETYSETAINRKAVLLSCTVKAGGAKIIAQELILGYLDFPQDSIEVTVTDRR